MDKYVINGGKQLFGEVEISGAKNAAIAIIPACILADDVCRIENLPSIKDVTLISEIIEEMGVTVRRIDSRTLEIDPRTLINPIASHDMVSNMRASYYLLGALLGKYKHAEVAMPGGCNFGVRPIDQHLKGFEALGASTDCNGAIIKVNAEKLHGSEIYFDIVSVGATINVMLAAAKAEGLTVIENAAREPHVVDVANFLNSMGANIKGAGTDTIKIRGVEHLSGSTYSIIPDQIEAGTYLTMVAATGGDVLIKNIIPKHLDSITAKLKEVGVEIEEYDESIRVISSGNIKKCTVKTMPHPGFPTDMQPQFTALLTTASGTSIVNESVWNDRFQYIEELTRFGAKISVAGRSAIIEGVDKLYAAPVRATDLRAGAAMIIAALKAVGVTEISEIKHIERGYEKIIEKLVNIGADIKKVSYPESYIITA